MANWWDDAPLTDATTTDVGTPELFKKQYRHAAERAGKELGVDPNVILGQWGLETGWGKSVIPGTNNLGNVKSEEGVSAKDNSTGSVDKYKQYKSLDDFADDWSQMIKDKYPKSVGSGSNAQKFAVGLKGYAQDPKYSAKVVAASEATAKAHGQQTDQPSDDWWKSAPVVAAESAPAADQGTQQPDQSEPTRAQQDMRGLGLGARAVTEGAASPLTFLGDTLNRGVNLGIRGVNALTGAHIPQFGMPSQAVRNALTSAGLPQPATPTERVLGDIQAGATGALTGAGLAGGLSRFSANPVTQNVLAQLAERPRMQAVSAATGAGAAGVTREEGGGPVAQLLASLAGGLAPSSMIAAGAAATRNALRGSSENIPGMLDRMKTFEEAGSTRPSMGQVSESRNAQALESLLSKTPGGAGQMAKRAEQQAEEIGARATKIADDLSPNATPSVAGRTIEKGLSGPGGFVDRFKQGQKALYDKLDSFIKPQTQVKVSNTAKALGSMNEDIKGAEALSRFFKNRKIQDIEAALKEDTAGTSAGVMVVPPNATTAEARAAASHGLLKRRPEEVRPGQAELYGRSARVRNPYTGKVSDSTRMAGRVPSVTVEPNSAATPGYSGGKTVPVPGGSPTNQLPYEALKKLRTLVGNEISDSSLSSDVPRSKWKSLYAALSKDLDAAAKETGNPAAVKAMERANAFSRAGHARIEDVLDKVAKQDIPEKVFKSAVNPADMQAGATKIGSIMKSLTPAERDVVKSAFIRRMGLASAGQQGAEGERFSTQTFLTNWNKMSPQAKSVMFSGQDGRLRISLDQIAKASESIKSGSKVFSNPSGTSHATAQIGLAGGIAGSIASGHIGVAAGLIGGAAGANLTARLMTYPPFVQWLAKSTRLSPAAVPAAVSSLQRSMQSAPDDVKQDAESYLKTLK